MNGTGNVQLLGTLHHIASYENKMSIAEVEAQPKAISTQITSGNQILIKTKKDEKNHEIGWINGTFLLKFPKEIIDLQVNAVRVNDILVKIDNYEVYEEDENFYIKIYTSNTIEVGYNIMIDCDMTADPRVSTSSTNIELYATNEKADDYYYKGEDIYDVNNNGNVQETINYSVGKLELVSPSSLLTSSSASEYDKAGTVTVAPRKAKIDKKQREAKISMNVTNNYKGTISDIVMMGKIPFVGNSYIINGRDLDSQFTTTMKNTGIEVPEELKPYTQVYYTTNENPTIDMEKIENGWITAEDVENWNDIKSYAVVFENYVMPQDKSFAVSYRVNIPEGLDYNKVTYCTHAIHFSLDTEEGKYRTKVESNKLGLMIATQYDLELTKYQIKTDKKVEGATYLVTDTQSEETRTAVTDKNGNLTIKGLYAEKEYTIKETKTPQEYQLNEEEIKINSNTDEQGNLQVNIINGSTRNLNVIKEEKEWKVKLEVEDEPKARLQIIKTNKDTGEKISGAQFKITGNGKGGITYTTDQQGEISLKEFLLGEEYTIEETKANGYFLMEPSVKFMVTREEGEYNFSLTNGEVYRAEITKQDEIPVLTLEIQNEPRPTYQLQIVKVEKNTTDGLAGAKFKIEGAGIDKAQNHTTNETGNITINGLYIGTDENDEVEYTLTETEAPQGYIKTAPIKLKTYNQGEELKLDITSGEVKETNINGNIITLTIEDEPVFKLVKKDGETATLLPNVKFALYAIGANAEETFATSTNGEVLGELETINGETYRVLKTDENGQIRADLAEGLYKVVELETLEKYELPEEIEERSYYFGIGNSRAGEIEFDQEWKATQWEGEKDNIKQIIQTSDGGYLANGYFYSPTITLPNGKVLTNHGTTNSFIMKYNAEGEIEWGDSIGGSGYDYSYNKILETTDGGYIVAGFTSNTSVTLSNGDVLTSKGGQDIVVVKYDSKGNILWSDMIGGTQYEQPAAITETSNGGIMLVTGATRSNSIISLKTGKEITIESSDGSLVLQYDKNGNIEWHKEFPFGISGIAEAENDEYLVEGFFRRTIALPNGETITSQNWSQDAIVAKFDKQGNIKWYDTIAGNGEETESLSLKRNGIIRTKDGGYLVVGELESDSLKLSNGDELFGARHTQQFFIIKYSEDGRIDWSHQIDSTQVYEIVCTKDGGFILIDHKEIVKFDKNREKQWSKTIEIIPNSLVVTDDGKYVIGGSDATGKAVLAKYDVAEYPEVENLMDANVVPAVTKYNTLWGEMVGGENAEDLGKIHATSDGGYITGSYFEGTITLSNGTQYTSKGSKDALVIKYDKDNHIEWSDTFGGTGEDKYLGYTQIEDGGYIAVGEFRNTITLSNGVQITAKGDSDGIIIKYDNEGNIVWYDTLASSAYDCFNDVTKTQDGGLIAVGNNSVNLVLSNGNNVTNAGGRDGIIIKYDREGNIVWYKQWNGKSTDNITNISSTNDGGFIIAGSSESNGTFIDGKKYIFPKGKQDALIVKYDKDGNVQWLDSFGGTGTDYVNNTVQTSDGGYVVVGKFSESNIGLSNGQAVQKKGESDGILIKYDSKGNIEYHREMYSLQGVDEFSDVTALREGGFVVSGVYQRQKAELSTGETTTGRGYQDSAIIKFSNDGKVLNIKTLENTPHMMSMQGIDQLGNGDIILSGQTTACPTLQLDSGLTLNNHGGYNTWDGYVLRCQEVELEAEKPGKLELKIDNNRKEYNIKTKVEPINGVKGGSISGEKDFIYETVKYGDSNTKSIVMTPDTNYEIIKITINGEEQKFTANADGTYTMPTFSDVIEDKEIVVSYALSSNKIEIEKVDAEDNNIKLEGAKIRLERIPDDQDATEYEVELVTNSEGKIVTQLPYGTYRVTEIEAPEGYQINTTIDNIEFVENGNDTFTIQDNKKPSVIVHHMLKDRTGNYTNTKLAEDEIYQGEKGESYTTQPKLDMVGYDLEKDEDGEYVVPDNAAGVYGEGKTIVTYYYEEKQIPLTVHYYIEGTENKVPLSDNQLAQDVVKQGYKGENYTTESLTNVNEKYELVEVPSNSNGTYGEEEIVVIYYYKLKTYHITTKVVEHEETDSLGQVSKVKGGTILGEGQNPYETVVYGENAIKDLIVTPEEGYQVKTIKINGEEISFTAKEDKTVELSKLENVREDKEIEVEFEKVTGTVIVHHYITGTTTKVPAKDTGVVEDEIKIGFVGNIYATKPSENASDAYEFAFSTGETNGTYTEDDIVVIYYYGLREAKITEAKELTTENSRKFVVPGEKITYKITITNEGNLGKDVVVKDNIPEGTTFVEGSIKIGEEAKDTMTAEDLANGITINMPMAGKEGASKKDLTFEVTVSEDKTGDISNIATVDDKNTNEVIIPVVSYETNINKTSNQDKITAKDTNVYYEIEFNATIEDFEGKAVATIVDTLPYPINEGKSELDGGTYDAETKTITWQQEINNIDTFLASEAKSIKIIKTISLSYVYGNLDDTTGSMKNAVEGTIALQAPKKDNPAEYETIGEDNASAEKEIAIEIPAEVKVHHYIYDAETGTNTTTKLVEDETKQGIIGQEYTTSKSAKVPANYTCVSEEPENHAGKMKEAPIDVNYYYQLTTPTLENNAQKTVTANKTDESGMAVLTKENGVVTYNLTYDVSVKDYIGKATVSLVDTLPAKIDVDASNLAGGTYNEAKHTITWEEEINNINTFANGNYTNTITKQITVVYKEQNVLEDLVNTVTGEIKTYYPENHLNKGGKEFVKEEDTKTATLKQEYKTNLKVVKVWDDNEDLKGRRPDSVTIKIIPSNGTEVTEQLKESNKWTYENKGLPKYDETTGRKITYTITESETEKGDLEYYEKAVITPQESQTDEVTNYQYTVTNTYKLTKTNLNTQLTKTGTKEITKANDVIDYTINLKAEIKDYIGEGKVVIVDTLPYKIDVTKSELAEGVYDDEKQTITFEQELPHINTETAKESYKIDITKQLKLAYKDIDVKQDKITNTVNGKIELFETEQKDEKTVSFDTNIDVKGKVIVKYINKIDQKEIADREEIVDKVGKRYTTVKKQIENYKYMESTNNETGEIKEEEQEVIYYYEPQETSVLVKYQDKNGKTIAEDIVIKGHIGDIYKTEKKDIDNYKLVEIKGEAQGVMTKNQTEVIYVYEATDLAKVIVKYLEKQEQTEETKEIELLPSETIEGHIGDDYEVARKVVENYRAVEPEPTNASGKMTAETIEVIYYYEKIPSGKVNIKYIDIETEEEITHGENKEVYGYEITGFVGDKYEAKQIDIPYYTFVKSTDNKTGILTEVGDTVICYYRKLNFNISIDKTISNITLNGRNVSLFDNQLAKVEIDAKQIDSADLIIKYNIKVTNEGELAGKAKVLDKLPAGCDISELPEYWNIRTDGMIESEVELKVGESKDLNVTLKWVKGQANLGTKANIAQIESTKNDANYEESDTKDNISEATVIIGIRTGEWMNRIMIVILVTSLVGYTYIILTLRRNIKKQSK